MSDSQKHRDFVKEPMTEKAVKDLAGIGKKLAERLSEKGYQKAYHVLAKFLMFDKDQSKFEAWLEEEVGADSKERADCSNCLKGWCDNYL